MRMHRWYTKEEIKFVKKNIKGRPYLELLKMFNKRFKLNLRLKQLETMCDKHGIKNGIGKFRRGHVPYNKGKKLGHHDARYSNFKPFGAERVIFINKKIYVEVKTGHLRWERKQALLYRKAHGRIPKGNVVIFADGNTRNFSPDNLLLVSRAELAVMNTCGLIKRQGELTRTGKIIADVKLAIGKLKTRKKGRK